MDVQNAIDMYTAVGHTDLIRGVSANRGFTVLQLEYTL